MISVKLVPKRHVRMPELRWSREFWGKVGKVAEGAALDNLRQQRTTDGGRLKANAPKTRERKRKEGKPLLSLVDEEHRFVRGNRQSWKILRYLPRNTGVVVGAATDELKKLVRYTAKMGYVGYLGLSTQQLKAVRALIRQEFRAMFRTAAGRQ